MVVVGDEADALGVEGLRAIDVADRERDQLELHVHGRGSFVGCRDGPRSSVVLIAVSFCPQYAGYSEPCWRPPRACSSLLSLLQAAGPTGRARSSPTRLEVGIRTVRRDIDRLRALGYEVRSAPGVGGGYRLGAGAAMPPLLLDDEEAVAVAVGLRAAASVGIAGIEETSVRALAKLEQVLPARVRRRVSAVGSATVPYPVRGPVVHHEVLARDRLRLPRPRAPALPLPQPRRHERAGALVEPHRLVHTGRRWYLVAWDATREDWRTFRVDRIEPTPSGDRRFVAREPPASDLAAYVARGVAVVARPLPGADRAARAARGGGAAGAARTLGTLARDRRRDAACSQTGSDWLGGLAIAYIAELGFDFEVLEPPELADRVRLLAERLARASAAGAATAPGGRRHGTGRNAGLKAPVHRFRPLVTYGHTGPHGSSRRPAARGRGGVPRPRLRQRRLPSRRHAGRDADLDRGRRRRVDHGARRRPTGSRPTRA